MFSNQYNLLLADDDVDDCIFFKEALEELPLATTLITVNDGVKLMELLLQQQENLPDIIFLDLNMPRKTGYECLAEIKHNKLLQHLPIIVFSTSYDPYLVKLLYEKGAHYYVRKPGAFSRLKELIHKVISVTNHVTEQRPSIENFVLNSE